MGERRGVRRLDHFLEKSRMVGAYLKEGEMLVRQSGGPGWRN